MTRDDVIRLALEAGFTWEPINNIADPLERFATLVLEADDGPWKVAVIDQLVIAHILTAEHESDPLKAIQDLLAYNSDIAVDPRVSGADAKLVEQAKAEVESAATERANERANASWALMCEKMVAADREACASVRLPVTAFDFRQKILKGELDAKYDEGFLDGIKAMRAAIRARGRNDRLTYPSLCRRPA